MIENGVFPLSKLLQSGQLNYQSALTNKIQPTVSDTMRQILPSTQGWCGVVYPAFDALLVNVPGQSIQWVMNTVTGALSSFSGWAATDFLVRTDGLYFGTTAGTIYKAWDGNAVADAGSDITTTAHCAYSDFNAPTKTKRIEEFRPLLAYDGPVQISYGISVDYKNIQITNLISRTGSNPGTPWDTSPWDTSDWSADITRQKLWRTASHYPGYALALWLQTASNAGKLYWSGTDYILSGGTIL
jgi:hypothetical protein